MFEPATPVIDEFEKQLYYLIFKYRVRSEFERWKWIDDMLNIETGGMYFGAEKGVLLHFN